MNINVLLKSRASYLKNIGTLKLPNDVIENFVKVSNEMKHHAEPLRSLAKTISTQKRQLLEVSEMINQHTSPMLAVATNS